jgi:hypothetical protein
MHASCDLRSHRDRGVRSFHHARNRLQVVTRFRCPPGALAVVTVKNAMGERVGTGSAPTFTGSAYGDESLLPRIRVAYVELNWGGGTDILRVGQFHNLLLPQIAASANHTGTPLGYGAVSSAGVRPASRICIDSRCRPTRTSTS